MNLRLQHEGNYWSFSSFKMHNLFGSQGDSKTGDLSYLRLNPCIWSFLQIEGNLTDVVCFLSKDSDSLWRITSCVDVSSPLLMTQCRLNLRPGALRDRAAGGDTTPPGTKQSGFPVFLHFGEERSPAVKQWFHSSSSNYCTLQQVRVHSNQFYSLITQKGHNFFLDHLIVGWIMIYKYCYRNPPSQLLLSDFPLLLFLKQNLINQTIMRKC